MCSGAALTVTAVVPEYVWSARRQSPAITRERSDDVAPHRFIHRRIGNQYSAARVRIAMSVGTMGPSRRGLRHGSLGGRGSIVGSRLLQEGEHARVHDVVPAGAHIV